MINFLTENPGVLMFLNCIIVPAVCFTLGYLFAKFRPQFRSPITLERDAESIEERF